ncbi:MAG: helix-turn-helix transcriptional regulator, partial [Akkermansiaceae bacterium]|nr:helix-turn-helix transcriptional regulator [Armatimonadota bacterium]
LLALFWRHAERIPDRSRGSASPGITGNTPEMFPHWLVEVIALITQDPARHLPDLAFHAGVSPTQLRRAFRRHLGVTPVEYLNRARLERARSLIETTDGTVSEIATRVGLDSLSYFTKRYKEAFGHTPGRHRTRGI